MSMIKMFIAYLTGYGGAIAAILAIGGFILNPIFQHPKGLKRAIICLIIAVFLIGIFILIAKSII